MQKRGLFAHTKAGFRALRGGGGVRLRRAKTAAEAGGHACRSQTVEPSMRRESRGLFLPFSVLLRFSRGNMWKELSFSRMEVRCLG